MISDYRKRFIILNMALIGVVLLAAFILLDVYLYRKEYKDIQSTLSLITEPKDFREEDHFPGAGHQVIKPSDKSGTGAGGHAPEAPPQNNKPPEGGGHIVNESSLKDIETDSKYSVVFYNKDNNDIAVISKYKLLDEQTMCIAAKEICAAENDHGVLRQYNMIYFRRGAIGTVKISMASLDELTGRVLSSSLMLFGIFIASMGVFLLISIWLSKIAAGPMERAIEMERRFIADISHELKTPVTVVMANNGILKNNPESKVSEQLEWIESTDAAARNMMTLVDEMLTLSSLETAERKSGREMTDLSSITRRCLLQMDAVAYERGVTLTCEIADNIVVMATDSYAERICSGLIENALKYEPPGGNVRVALAADRKTAALTVRNPGSVVESEDLPYIFDRFYRADKSRGAQKGHGLGLSIIKQMTELIGADISVSSSTEDGTVFTVTFELGQ